jgi:predicted ATPase
VRYIPPSPDEEASYPFSIPLIQSLSTLEFRAPVTLFVGENGTGKSTLLEGIAAAVDAITVGGESVKEDQSLAHARKLAAHLKLTWEKRTRKGFFLRAEDFINFARRMRQTREEMTQRLEEIEEEYRDRSEYAKRLARMPYLSSIHEMDRRYGEDLEAKSHGESFFRLFQSRMVPNGLYLLDEPETPLSPVKQLSLIAMIKDMTAQNCQFIIATHSPILMAIPGAVIWCFDELPIREVGYEDLEHVQLTRAFLNNPEQFLRHL